MNVRNRRMLVTSNRIKAANDPMFSFLFKGYFIERTVHVSYVSPWPHLKPYMRPILDSYYGSRGLHQYNLEQRKAP